MNATVNPTTATTATPGPAERGAAAGAADARRVAGGGGNTTPTSNTGDGASSDSSESSSWWDRIKEFFSSFTEEGGIGKVLGGLLGLGGAWLAGNFFGGGIMSTILMVALAIPLMLVGSDSIGGWINGLLGHGETSRDGDSAQPGQSRAASVGTHRSTSASTEQVNSPTATPFTPTMTLTNEEMLAMVNPTNGQPDTNTRDRLEIFVDPNDPSRRLQVRPVADSVADRPGIITLDALREQVGPSASGIVFGQALNGVVSVQAAPIGALPNSSTAQSRR